MLNCVVLNQGEDLQCSIAIIILNCLAVVMWPYTRLEHTADRDPLLYDLLNGFGLILPVRFPFASLFFNVP